MLIVKRGEKPHEYMKFYCGTCGTIFITERDEHLHIGDRWHSNCPVCGSGVQTREKVSDEDYRYIRGRYEQKE